jgi:lysine biosynthesis protein LysW
MKKLREGICPACGATIYLPLQDIYKGNVIHCRDCGAKLEIIEEDPLDFEGIFEDEEEDI